MIGAFSENPYDRRTRSSGSRMGLHAGRRLARAARERSRSADGFTLIELLVALVVMTLLFAAFATLIESTLNASARITDESVLQTQVRSTVDALTDALRDAYPPSTSATSAFVTSGGVTSPTSLTFYAPAETYSASTPTSFPLSEFSYQLSGGNFQRAFATSTNSGGPPWTMPALSSWVTEFGGVTNSSVFTYYTSTGAVTTNPANVASVVVTLTVRPSVGESFTYSNEATLRVPA